MKPTLSFSLLSIVIFCSMSPHANAVPAAFPGAEGSGRFAVGGRGGAVYEVTHLTNSGPGSIVDAVSQGNRTIVFRVSGTIELGDILLRPKSNTTIAGQTAPGDGICLKGRIYISGVENVVIRYLRVRVDEGGANSSGDAIDIAGGSNIIIDHVSASYARDETISCQDGSDKVTVQWCILSEALTYENHSYGSLIRGQYGESKTYHHNLYAHNKGRNPRPGNYTSSVSDPEGLHFDFRNNVVYNWAGGHPGYNADKETISRYNFVGNVFIRGVESSGSKAFKEDAKGAYAYWSGNAHGASYGTEAVFANQWDLVTFNGFDAAQIAAYQARSYPIAMEPVTTTSAAQALVDVLDGAGAVFPVRDIIDTRIVNDVISGTGHSIATTEDQPEGGWPVLHSLPAPVDSDHDGMPDAWETVWGLDENDPADRNNYDLHQDYTNLEVYLNSLVAADLEAPAPPAGLTAAAGDTGIVLDWDDNLETDLAGYHVYRAAESGGPYTRLNTSLCDASGYTDDTAEYNKTYFYAVTAADTAFNESGYSDEAFAARVEVDFFRDTNDDGRIDLIDLAAFLEVWLQSGCLLNSGWDMNADCRVDYAEFGLLAEHWLDDRATPVIIQENESGFCGYDGIVEQEHTGYTGAGYTNTDNLSGSGINYRLDVLTPGTYTFTFRYAGTSARAAALIIDGFTETSIDFPPTGLWTIWTTTAAVEVQLTEGIKHVRLEAITGEGLSNIDYLEVSGTHLQTTICP